jgi:thioredoxin 1
MRGAVMLNQITTIAELQQVVQDNPFVVIDLFATWCVPCQQMLPVIEELAGENPAVPFYKVDIDMVPEAKEFTGAKAVPMLIIYKNGGRREFAFGVTPKEKIQQKLTRVMR